MLDLDPIPDRHPRLIVWTGRRGRIVHPGKASTAYVHVAFADINHALICHPNSVRIIEARP